MNKLRRQDLRELVEDRAGPCISLFMPTARLASPDLNRARFNDLIGSTKRQLRDMRYDEARIAALLRGAERLQADDDSWKNPSAGLAVFCAEGFFRFYRLPLPVQPHMHVGPQFRLRPLMPLARSDGRFYVLALTHTDARLFLATEEALSEVELVALRTFESDLLQQRTHQSGASQAAAASTLDASPNVSAKIFSRIAGESRNELLQLFYGIDQSVCQTLRGDHVPLVLACVGYLAPIYEAANSYSNLIKRKVPGTPQLWTTDELHDRAWRLVRPCFQQEHRRVIAAYRGAAADCRSSDVRQILLAADEGRLETLLLARRPERIGQGVRDFDATELDNPHRAADEDLLDVAAMKTWISGGAVYCLESIPESTSTMAAIFRQQ